MQTFYSFFEVSYYKLQEETFHAGMLTNICRSCKNFGSDRNFNFRLRQKMRNRTDKNKPTYCFRMHLIEAKINLGRNQRFLLKK
jgi:hypothetical protein